MAKVLNHIEIIVENFNRLSRAHERYRQRDSQTTNDRRTGDSSSRSLKPNYLKTAGLYPATMRVRCVFRLLPVSCVY